jgi:hypothetical protein
MASLLLTTVNDNYLDPLIYKILLKSFDFEKINYYLITVFKYSPSKTAL